MEAELGIEENPFIFSTSSTDDEKSIEQLCQELEREKLVTAGLEKHNKSLSKKLVATNAELEDLKVKIKTLRCKFLMRGTTFFPTRGIERKMLKRDSAIHSAFNSEKNIMLVPP